MRRNCFEGSYPSFASFRWSFSGFHPTLPMSAENGVRGAPALPFGHAGCAQPCQAARSVIAPYRFPAREICFASAIQACALLADFMISYHISTSLACWIASNKSDISNCIILYHKTRPATENFAVAKFIRREAISELSFLPDARYEHPYIRSTAQNLTMRPGAPDAVFVRFARWRRI